MTDVCAGEQRLPQKSQVVAVCWWPGATARFGQSSSDGVDVFRVDKCLVLDGYKLRSAALGVTPVDKTRAANTTATSIIAAFNAKRHPR